MKFNKKLKKLDFLLKPLINKYILLFFLMIIYTSFSLINPLLYSNIIKDLFSRDFSKCKIDLIVLIIVSVFSIFFSYIANKFAIKMKNNLTYQIKILMYTRLINLHIKEFINKSIGEFMSRINGDANIFSESIVDKIPYLIIEMLKLILIFLIMTYINPYLAGIQLILIIVYIFIFKRFGKILIKLNAQLKYLYDKYFSITQQGVRGIKDVKILGIKNIHIDDVKETCLKINYKTVEIGKISLLSNVCIESLNILQISIQIIIGSYLIYINKLDINSFITFLLYSQQITSSINILTQANGIISRMIVSLNRILELLDEKIYEVEIFGDKKINSNITDIEFCNVSFSYNNRKKILDNINFKIDKKSKIAIVGKSGEGKSTILNLITKLYSPDEGLIKINNININNISEKEIRDKISVVNQEPFLFNKTIKENFLMVNSNAKEKDIIQACKEAHIYNFIKNLPKGLDTIVGENGANLSVGQKQRLAIARILIKECNIILLDEITSSLDNESQFFINKTIQSLSKKYTIITVTHKISNITNYDKILILNNKKIEDIGTHTELMIRNSLYKNLYQKELNN